MNSKAVLSLALAIAGTFGGIASAEPIVMPAIFPTPVSVRLGDTRVALGTSVVLVAPPGTDAATVDLVRTILKNAGVQTIVTQARVPVRIDRPYVVVGTAASQPVRDALVRLGAAPPTRDEGYTLASARVASGSLIVLAGRDDDGLFHAAQTLRQIVTPGGLPAIAVQDHPAMPVRGTIEGFYGTPWSMADRAKHIAFLGRVKANTYIYSPKDDAFARARWRDAYPAATLGQLGELATLARRDHVDFVYAISPGVSVCYSDPAERRTLAGKFAALRSIGVRRFYVALDDIEYTKWNCAGDNAAFGPPNGKAAAVAQASLLNAVQAALPPGAPSLIMVPTEYYDAKETPYKAALRAQLNPDIVVQWTGTDVVPPAISVSDAQAATKAFGRKTLLWDNYPVNDYATSAGRLLLAPYARREAGLSAELTGVVSNPMNQEAPSRVAVMGVTGFAWNDAGYDADRTWRAAASDLAGGDADVTEALLTFFDTQHLAPTFGSHPWQPQAPRLKAMLDGVREALATGDATRRQRAIDDLAAAADDMARAPDIITAGVADTGFAAQSRPWLDAMILWGRALRLTAAGLGAANGDQATANGFFAEAKRLSDQAAAVPPVPGANRIAGPIRVADGVLDRFILDAPMLIAAPAR